MAKIMLVEDDNNLREIYGARLQAEGHEIVAARDGEEALALAVKEKPELIISDVMMPRISGFDMLDILRNAPETKNTKVIMMTALSQAEDKSRADKLGADRYLVKSQVTLEDVASVVSEVLNGPNDGTAVNPADTSETLPTVSQSVPAAVPTPAPAPAVTAAPAPQAQPEVQQQTPTPQPAPVAPVDPALALAEPQQSTEPVSAPLPPASPEIIPVTAPPSDQPATTTPVADDDAATKTDNTLQAIAAELAHANLDDPAVSSVVVTETATQSPDETPKCQPTPAIAVEMPPQTDSAPPPASTDQPTPTTETEQPTNDLFAGSSLAEVLATEEKGSTGSLPSAAPASPPADQSSEPTATQPDTQQPVGEETTANNVIQASQSAIAAAPPPEPEPTADEPAQDDDSSSTNNSGMKVINPIGDPLASPDLDKLLADEERKLAVENPVASTVITPEKKSDELNNISL